MGRAPCCDKVGLKRGPWTPEEDHVLISFIIQHGHSNWRALPKQAGLLRCGKSCRLRWINYLKPDIKRGNFSKEEEDTIIQLHEMMGNRWSAIAARLPGRTDNEIKNVWHTHLKKRLNKQNQKPKSQGKVANKQHCDNNNNNIRNNNNNININVTTSNSTSENDYNYNYNLYEISDGKCEEGPNYSQQSYSSDDFSSITEVSSVQVPNSMANATDARKYDENKQYELDELPIVDATFWSSQEFSYDDLSMDFEIPSIIEDEKIYGENNNFSTMCMANTSEVVQGGGADFWFDLFVNGSAPELLEF